MYRNFVKQLVPDAYYANVMLQALHRGSGHCEAIKNSGPVHGAGGEHGDQAKRATATYGVM